MEIRHLEPKHLRRKFREFSARCHIANQIEFQQLMQFAHVRHVSLVDIVGKCWNNDGSHCIMLAILSLRRQ
jgi:hypothetical protein